MTVRYGLWSYVRHAERVGTELVYETAIEDLSARERGALALQLRRIDSGWRLGDRAARALAVALLADHVAADEVARMVGRDRTTIWRLRREMCSETALGRGADVAIPVCASNGSRGVPRPSAGRDVRAAVTS